MKILLDLTMLRHPNCGLGQVAKNYGLYFQHQPIPNGDEVVLFVPKGWVGAFGENVSYLEAKDLYRWLPCMIPHWRQIDIWHSIHQLSAFQPPKGIRHRVLTIHDLNFLHEKQGKKRLQFLRRLQHEVDCSEEIGFISGYAMQEAKQHLMLPEETHLHKIYNGVEDTTAGPQVALDGLDKRRFWLCMGVVKEKKNLHVLLPMMQLLPDYQLVVAGDDSDGYAKWLRNEIKRQKVQNVTLTGPVNDDQRRWLYGHCEGLLFPSKCEGFGLPVIEMMQWGKPVIASQETSLREIGGTCACYFDDYTPEAMSERVKDCLAKFDAKKAEEEIQYAGKFTYQSNIEAYLKIYEHFRK